jgi:hypothetical protein
MSFFEKVFSETQTDLDEAPEAPDVQAPDTPFASYVKEMVRFGGVAPESMSPPEVIHTEPDEPWSDEEELTQEAEAIETEIEPRQEAIAPVLVPVVVPTKPTHSQPVSSGVVRASSIDQKSDGQVERIVDGLFDKMRVVWGNEDRRGPSPIVEQTQQPKKHLPAPASKNEITALIRNEVPRAIKGELVTVLRTEIMAVVRSEIARVVHEEFEGVTAMMTKQLDRLHAIEARLAKIEGAVEKDVQITFPEGTVKIDMPITIPEREVKIAAPINVQPPHVTFDQGAISVQFNKTPGGKKEVHFERDPHDQSIKSAEIIDVKAETVT